MNTRDNDPLHRAINSKLAQGLAALPQRPAWYSAWTQLGPESPEEERLAVYQAIRDSDFLPEAAGFYLVSWQIDAMASLDPENRLGDLEDRIEALESKYGMEEGAILPLGKAGDEYRAIRAQYYEAWDTLLSDKLMQFGEEAMAQLLKADRARFDQLNEAGRQYFHGGDEHGCGQAPLWLEDLVRTAAECMAADSPIGPLGYRYREDEGLWEVWVYPMPVELLGGAVDGKVVAPGYSLDLRRLPAALDRVDDFGFSACAFPGSEGPHVWIEGIFHGHAVLVEVLARAPEDEEPGMKVDVNRCDG